MFLHPLHSLFTPQFQIIHHPRHHHHHQGRHGSAHHGLGLAIRQAHRDRQIHAHQCHAQRIASRDSRRADLLHGISSSPSTPTPPTPPPGVVSHSKTITVEYGQGTDSRMHFRKITTINKDGGKKVYVTDKTNGLIRQRQQHFLKGESYAPILTKYKNGSEQDFLDASANAPFKQDPFDDYKKRSRESNKHAKLLCDIKTVKRNNDMRRTKTSHLYHANLMNSIKREALMRSVKGQSEQASEASDEQKTARSALLGEIKGGAYFPDSFKLGDEQATARSALSGDIKGGAAQPCDEQATAARSALMGDIKGDAAQLTDAEWEVVNSDSDSDSDDSMGDEEKPSAAKKAEAASNTTPLKSMPDDWMVPIEEVE